MVLKRIKESDDAIYGEHVAFKLAKYDAHSKKCGHQYHQIHSRSMHPLLPVIHHVQIHLYHQHSIRTHMETIRIRIITI